MKVIVGLGNPGQQYESTRHNVGFEVVRELARRGGASFGRSKFEADIAEIFLGGSKVQLVLPQTYMNRSGQTVGRMVDFFDLDMSDLSVVCDDMNLETGRIRWRAAGSAGGQKGLANIIQHLGSQEFPRLRIGIGRPPGKMDVTSYVLGRFSRAESELIEVTCQLAADSLELWVRDGLAATMNKYNSASPQAES